MSKTRLYSNIIYPDSDFRIISIANRTSSIDDKNNYSKMFHEDIEIKLFYEGSSTLIIDNNTIITAPGDLVVINPYEFHSTVEPGDTKGQYHLIMIGLDFFENSVTNSLNLRSVFIKDRTKINSLIKDNYRIKEIATNIVFELEHRKCNYKQAVSGLVLELFSLLLRDYRSDKLLDLPEDKNIRNYELIYPAISKIRNDYVEKINIDNLATMCNVSKYHFCRIFKQVTSLSAIQYQTVYRLQIADNLLLNSDKTISEIANLCGFEDVCYFSRCYKKHLGVSPRQKRAILSK